MSAADQRIAELLDRWLASIELHARYLELDAAAYARVQDWPKHQRPTKWVVELARARLVELKRQFEERKTKADAGFAESLELMSFLTTLLGSEHVERFIPLATGKPAAVSAAPLDESVEPPGAQAQPQGGAPAKEESPAKSTGDTTTRQVLAIRPKGGRQASSATGSQRRASSESATSPRLSEKMIATVIADAVRFLSWGREWPQLASSIARLADRPPEQEILKVLRSNRAKIEAAARRPPD